MPSSPSKPFIRLMIDSGAFAAWNRKASVDLNEYMTFLKRHEKVIWNYISLDKIPEGSPTQWTEEVVDQAAAQSYRNLQIMNDAGLHPIPVLRQGDRFIWLEKLLKDKQPYIALSTRKDVWSREQIKWLDEVWSMLSNAKGEPLLKIHGLGITNRALITRYPWHSVDSTSWSLAAGYGQILVPAPRAHGFDYLNAMTIHMNDREKELKVNAHKSKRAPDFDSLGRNVREKLEQHFEAMGLSLTALRYDPDTRRELTIRYFLGLEAACQGQLFKTRIHSLEHEAKPSTAKGLKLPLHLFFATQTNLQWVIQFKRIGVHNQLLAFDGLRSWDPDAFDQLIITGTMDRKAKVAKMNWKHKAYDTQRRLQLYDRFKKMEAEKEDVKN